MNNNRQQNRSGFTLIEVAVVLFIMGIFVSFASTMLRNLGVSNKLREAREKLTPVSDAVQAWANINRRLPTAIAGPDNFETILSQPRDYWNKMYTFRPYTPVVGAVNDICRTSSTNLSVCTNAGINCVGANVVQNIAYVLISNGDNLVPNTSGDDITTLPCTAAKPCMPIKDLSTTSDDLYKYVTLAELKKTAGCIEADSRLRILNGDLPPALQNNKYVVPVIADGGLNNLTDPKYSWCVQGNLPAGLSLVPVIASCPSSFTNATFVNISGVPTGASAPITFQVKDSNGVTNTKTFFLMVK